MLPLPCARGHALFGRPHVALMARARQKVYGVQVGRRPGVYHTWKECLEEVFEFPGAIFKGFNGEEEAQRFVVAGAAAGAAAAAKAAAEAVTHEIPEDAFDGLSDEQREVVKAVLDGKNIFLTGHPGTGKSFVLKRVIDILQRRHGKALAICASTGIAAVPLNGCTFHSFLGCRKGDEEGWLRAKKNKEARRRLRRTRVLILDEVSMSGGDFLDRAFEFISQVRAARGPISQALAGLQVVICGDFLQLPPVNCETLAFESRIWHQLELQPFILRQNFRQEDSDFKEFLAKLRWGKISLERLSETLQKTQEGSEETFPKLVSTNVEANKLNSKRLAELPGEVQLFEAEDWMEHKSLVIEKAMERLLVPQELQLKIGCVVMLLRNMHGKALVNGSVGRVVRFRHGFPVVQFAAGCQTRITPHEFEGAAGPYGEYRRTQVPLKLAWAMTIHKTQGLTLSQGEVDFTRVFEPAQLYVALSRFQCLEKVRVSGLPQRPPVPGQMACRALEFHRRLEVCPSCEEIEEHEN